VLLLVVALTAVVPPDDSSVPAMVSVKLRLCVVVAVVVPVSTTRVQAPVEASIASMSWIGAVQ
jgi:hypothetical protein